MKYSRKLQETLTNAFFRGKVVLVVGPRQVGKTTLSEDVLEHFVRAGKSVRRLNCDNPTDRDVLTNHDLPYLQQVIGTADILFIDEGQKVSTIGQTLKLLIDHYKETKQILVTGSSSFNLLDQTEEALTGRKRVYHLHPLALAELYTDPDMVQAQKQLPEQLVFGMYPEVVKASSFQDKQVALDELISSQLYKDIYEFQEVKDSTVLRNLLKALALQVGSEVSYTELAGLLGVNKKTVERYVDLLEKSYIIFRVAPYYTNKRNEIKKRKKIYFYDVGIRNAIIQNLNALDLRNDVGALFENFMMMERLKKRAYGAIMASPYFWRTYEGQEVDLIEEAGGTLHGYEFKWGAKKRPKTPSSFSATYPDATFEVITRDNFLDFVM